MTGHGASTLLRSLTSPRLPAQCPGPPATYSHPQPVLLTTPPSIASHQIEWSPVLILSYCPDCLFTGLIFDIVIVKPMNGEHHYYLNHHPSELPCLGWILERQRDRAHKTDSTARTTCGTSHQSRHLLPVLSLCPGPLPSSTPTLDRFIERSSSSPSSLPLIIPQFDLIES